MSQLLQAAIRSGATFEELDPVRVDQGIPVTINGNIASEDSGIIDHYHQGLPFTTASRIAGNVAGPVVRVAPGGAPFGAADRLCVSALDTKVTSASVNYDDGGSCTSGDNTDITGGGFSNGFSNGFRV